MKEANMQAVKVFLFISSMLLAALPVYALDDPKVAHAKYDELATKVNSGELNIDWQSLRLAARVGEVYGEYDPYDAAKRAHASFDTGDYEEAFKIARETEQHNIADIEAHVVAWSCLNKLGRQREADKEWSILHALVQSILTSGKGKSAKTAWFAVGIREEVVFLREVLQVQIKQQRSVKQDGHYYDMVLVTNQSGKDTVLWFNTDTDIELNGRAGDEGHHIY
jgi:tetratricopeptide (TPR) repeat protein